MVSLAHIGVTLQRLNHSLASNRDVVVLPHFCLSRLYHLRLYYFYFVLNIFVQIKLKKTQNKLSPRRYKAVFQAKDDGKSLRVTANRLVMPRKRTKPQRPLGISVSELHR